MSFLRLAVKNNAYSEASRLIKNESDAFTVLRLAISFNHIDMVKLALKKGVRLDLIEPDTLSTHQTVKSGNDLILKTLLDNGLQYSCSLIKNILKYAPPHKKKKLFKMVINGHSDCYSTNILNAIYNFCEYDAPYYLKMVVDKFDIDYEEYHPVLFE